MANIRNGVRRLQMIVFSQSYGDYQHNDILEPLRWNSHLTPLWPKWWPIFQNCHTPLKNLFKLFLCCSSLEPQFGAVTVKFSHNRITTQKMASLQNGVRHLQIIVFKCCYDAYKESNIFELLRWNLHLTPLLPERCKICKRLLKTSKLLFSAAFMVLIIRATIWSPYRDILS